MITYTGYGLALYYGGGFQSFGDKLKLSILFEGDVEFELNVADEELLIPGFDGYGLDLLAQLQEAPDAVAEAHEISDSIYLIGRTKEEVLAYMKDNFFNSAEAHRLFTNWMNSVRSDPYDTFDVVDAEDDDGESDPSFMDVPHRAF